MAMSISVTSGSSSSALLDRLVPVVGEGDDVDLRIRREHGLDHLDEEVLVVDDEDADPLLEGLGSGGHLCCIITAERRR